MARTVKPRSTGTSDERANQGLPGDPGIGPVQGELVTDVNESVTKQWARSIIMDATHDKVKVTVTLACGHRMVSYSVPDPYPDPFQSFICAVCNAF